MFDVDIDSDATTGAAPVKSKGAVLELPFPGNANLHIGALNCRLSRVRSIPGGRTWSRSPRPLARELIHFVR
jgi:hypothetical protein